MRQKGMGVGVKKQVFAVKRVAFEGDENIDINNEVKEGNNSNQVKVLSSLDHPNIIKYYESFTSKGRSYIVMDYADDGRSKG